MAKVGYRTAYIQDRHRIGMRQYTCFTVVGTDAPDSQIPDTGYPAIFLSNVGKRFWEKIIYTLFMNHYFVLWDEHCKITAYLRFPVEEKCIVFVRKDHAACIFGRI